MPNEIRIPSPSFAPLRSRLKGSVMDDPFNRGRHATDASIYQMMPHAVVVPETLGDVEATLDFAREPGHRVLHKAAALRQKSALRINHAPS